MIESFPDRSGLLFGRAADVRRLLDRASCAGLTTLVARPLMGKSWTLIEVARQLQEQGDLVGYHESKGAESSHLLYAVSNLYARWLSDSSMRQQAISLWARNKEALVPRVGQMVGTLFEKIGGSVVPEKVAGLVRLAFDGLVEAQKDLLTGGLQIAPLPYDQALSLTKLVAEVSGRRIVLMLDAWEKSGSARSEYSTLEAFLKHLESWPRTHMFLAVRYPELAAAKDNEAYQRAQDLCNLSPDAQVFRLNEMSLADAEERRRLVSWVKERVAAARPQHDDRLVEMIDAYPGVLYFWTNGANRSAMATADDLRKVAGNAQVGRYAELDRLLKAVPDGRIDIAARLAFLPRLDEVRWEALRDLVLGGLGIAEIDGLTDAAVLSDGRAPTYGHDTRQAAAAKWFVENRGPMMRRLSQRLIEAMAERITGVNRESRIYFDELIACRGAACDVGIEPQVGFLIDAADCSFGNVDGVMEGDFNVRATAATRRNSLLTPIMAQALNNRGATKGQRGDNEGAIADCTAAIELPGTSAEQVARALNNRSVTRSQRGDSEGAIADCTAVIELTGAPPDQLAKALYNRGVIKGQRSDNEGAVSDYTAVIELPGAPAEQVARVLNNRGVAKGERGDSEDAIADYTAAIELPGSPVDQVAQALYNRGVMKAQCGDNEGEVADYTAVIELSGAPAEQAARALHNRGVTKAQRGDNEGAIADYTAVIELPGVSGAQVANALLKRGITKGQRGDNEGAIADYKAVIELPGASADQVVKALLKRGFTKGQRGDNDGAIADCTAVTELPGVTADQVALALYNRGVTKGQRGDNEGEIADYSAVIDLPDAPADQVAKALNNRGFTKGQCGDNEGAIADHTAAIALSGAPADQVAKAFYSRGITKRQRGDNEGAIADCTAAIELPGASPEIVEAACRACDILKGASDEGKKST